MSFDTTYLVWTPPPGWPTPPPGWEPPQGWVPMPEWPPPPEGWQWWQPVPVKRVSDLRFHLVGLATLIAALVGFHVGLAFMSFVTSSCNDNPGKPELLHLAFLGASALLLSVPVECVRRAHRGHRAWIPWLIAVVICAAAVVNATRWAWHVSVWCFG